MGLSEDNDNSSGANNGIVFSSHVVDMSNPFESPLEEGSPPEKTNSLSLGWAIFGGAGWSVAASFPITAVLVSILQFPIPFRGIVSGPKFIPLAIFALLMYGIFLGGFVVLSVAGGLAGAFARYIGSTAAKQRLVLRVLAVGSSLFLLVVLAILDRIIGPW